MEVACSFLVDPCRVGRESWLRGKFIDKCVHLRKLLFVEVAWMKVRSVFSVAHLPPNNDGLVHVAFSFGVIFVRILIVDLVTYLMIWSIQSLLSLF